MSLKRNFHGFINLNKDSGPTSSFVVSSIKKMINPKLKVGHCGTLDPLASGVLPICIGHATRLSEFFLLEDKGYKVKGKFGLSTDTYDSTGKIIDKSDKNIKRDELQKALENFKGVIDQRPPLFSALKFKGERLYNIARKGGHYIPPKRKVKVINISLVKFEFPIYELDILVSSGFYARSLIHNLGEYLDCPSHMIALERTSVGGFHSREAIKLNQLSDLMEKEKLESHIFSIDYVLKNFKRVDMNSDDTIKLKNGVKIDIQDSKFHYQQNSKKYSNLIKAYDSQGRFFAILRVSEDGKFLKPEKVFHEN
mgnify:CR=1 FL=1